jgi:hypothetical protein
LDLGALVAHVSTKVHGSEGNNLGREIRHADWRAFPHFGFGGSYAFLRYFALTASFERWQDSLIPPK